jgi:hypothetical protein
LLPPVAIAPVAWLLPLLELAVAAALLAGWMLPAAGSIAALLLLTFIAAIVINLRRGRRIACNCHGSSQQTPLSWGLVAHDALLLLPALFLASFAPFYYSMSAIAESWRLEIRLLVSPAALPLAAVICCFLVCSRLLATAIDVRGSVRQTIRCVPRSGGR